MSAIQGAAGAGFRRFSGGQIVALIAALIAGLVLGWFGFKTAFGDGTQTAAPITGVTTVQPRTIQQFATTSGNVVAPANTKLTFPLAGRVASITVKQGQTVKQGDVIATLDQTQLKIALDQAQSQLNTAQARLDALNAPQTPDVIAAAQAGVAQAQAAEKSAEGQLSQAQTGAVTAGNGVGTAANAITTAQNQVQTAVNNVANSQSQVAGAESQLTQAQSSYQNLLNGPTPQDIAVSQASVDSAATSLQSAEDAYNRLINHTDLLTRPETTALMQASSAYQSALANFANAQPQPANQYDISNAQLAVSSAQAQVNLANQNVASAQQALALAQQNAANGAVSGSVSAGCVVATTPGACLPAPPEVIPPSASAQNAQQSAVLTAQNQLNQATTTAITAQSSYQQALNNLQKLLNPTNNTDFQGLQASVDSARQQYDVALQNYQNYLNLPDISTRPETTALNSARSAYNSAVAQYNLKVEAPKDTDIANAQAQIQSAQAALDAARAGEANANVAVGTAQVGVGNAGLAYQNAQATAGSANAAVNTAQSQIGSSQENVKSAQAKLDQLNAPPLPTDVTQAREAVNQAKLTVQNSQSNLDNSVITAPFPGIITSVNANPGDQVGSGTQIAGLVDPNNVELDAAVDETTYGQIKVGMPVLVRFDVLPSQPLTGTITKIIPSGTTTQGVVTFPIVITLNTPTGTSLPNGASASQIQIVLQAKSGVLAVPPRDVYRDPVLGTTVDVIKDNKRVPTHVEVGLVTDTLTEITSGLKAGDQVAPPAAKKGSSSSAFGSGGLPGGLGGGGGAGGGARPAGR